VDAGSGQAAASASGWCIIVMRSDVARIEGYRFGRVLVDGEEQHRDLIILPSRLVTNWWCQQGHALVLEDLEDVLNELPKRLIVGTGASGQMRPDPGTLDALRRRGVDVEVARTEAAVRRFADADPASTALALHLTC
jgi:hypothetical protein